MGRETPNQIRESGALTMGVAGVLSSPVLPLTGLGVEASPSVFEARSLQAVRRLAGSSGATTIQLELNLAPVPGAVITWVPGDGDYSVKSVALTPRLDVAVGDLLSLRLTSAELGAQDVHAQLGT